MTVARPSQGPRAGRLYRIERSIEIDAPPAKVFAFVAAEWETDLAFSGGRKHGWIPEPAAKLRPGLRASFDGKLLALRGRLEVEVRDFLEPQGWTAYSMSAPQFTWTWTFRASGRRCRTTQVCEYRPRGPRERLVEWGIGRRRRAEAVEASLIRLKMLVEREVALERLERSRVRS